MDTVKPVFFACPLFREFREPGKFVKITGHENLNTVAFQCSRKQRPQNYGVQSNESDSNAKIKGSTVFWRAAAMQAHISHEPGVCPSIRPSISHSRGLWQNERNMSRHSYATWKIVLPSFLTKRMVGGGDTYVKFWAKLTRLELLHIRIVSYGGYAFFQVHKILK